MKLCFPAVILLSPSSPWKEGGSLRFACGSSWRSEVASTGYIYHSEWQDYGKKRNCMRSEQVRMYPCINRYIRIFLNTYVRLCLLLLCVSSIKQSMTPVSSFIQRRDRGDISDLNLSLSLLLSIFLLHEHCDFPFWSSSSFSFFSRTSLHSP